MDLLTLGPLRTRRAVKSDVVDPTRENGLIDIARVSGRSLRKSSRELSSEVPPGVAVTFDAFAVLTRSPRPKTMRALSEWLCSLP